MNTNVCYRCSKPLDLPDGNKVSFRACCEFCDADLHVCVNCVFYSAGKPNDCLIPGTDFIADRTKNNLCEEFKLKGSQSAAAGPTKEEIERRLFGDL